MLRFIWISFIAMFLVACSVDSPESPQTPSPAQTPEAPAANDPSVEPPNVEPEVQEQQVIKTVHQLVAEDNFTEIHRLLKSGSLAELSTRDEQGRIPLHYAQSGEMISLLADMQLDTTEALFVGDTMGRTPFHLMALEGRHHALSYVITKLCRWWTRNKLNLRDKNGQTILHHVVLSRNKLAFNEVMRCNYIDYNALDSQSQTSLHLAVEDPDFTIGWMLLSNTPMNQTPLPLNWKNKFGQSAFELAKAKKNLIAIELLDPAKRKKN